MRLLLRRRLLKDVAVKKKRHQQPFDRIDWGMILIKMVDTFGVSTFFEIGPGKVLAGTVKRTVPNSNILSVGLASQIDEALEIINE